MLKFEGDYVLLRSTIILPEDKWVISADENHYWSLEIGLVKENFPDSYYYYLSKSIVQWSLQYLLSISLRDFAFFVPIDYIEDFFPN